MWDKPVATLQLGHALNSYPATVAVTFTTATTATIVLIAAAAKTATNTSWSAHVRKMLRMCVYRQYVHYHHRPHHRPRRYKQELQA